jgi:MFS transporter, DHA1 family, multidrug resistance protein
MIVQNTPRAAELVAQPSFAEFVAMMAASMALQAVAIDAMLPALGEIGRDFAVSNANQLQWIITAFMMGMGSGQLICGPLSDRFGRKPVLLTGLVLYVVLSLLAMLATSLAVLLTTRVIQGFVVAAASVVARSIVRDKFSGSTMARVSSTIFIVFLIVPMVAPALGQLLLLFVSWRGIFAFFAVCGLLVSVWIFTRLPETLRRENRQPLTAAHLAQAAWFVVSQPASILYTVASTVLFGSLLAYVSTVPQIFAGAFHRPGLMAITFAFCAAAMGAASYLNTRIVERVGMHRIAHWALTTFVVISGSHALIAYFLNEGVITFTLLQAATMACFGLSVANCNAIAMQPMGKIAGSAASVQGVISTVGGAAIAAIIGQQWSGSVFFLPAGAFICGLVAFGSVLLAERSRMFRRHIGG